VYSLLVACASAGELAARDVHALNTHLERAARMRALVAAGPQLEWRWRGEAQRHPDFILWQVALSASALLSGEMASRIRLCGSHDCGWLFVDHSRNGLRRWCSMEGCGNVEKARRYRSRQR
jgi:predicted RNA-binding Zn ribbon-like protein